MICRATLVPYADVNAVGLSNQLVCRILPDRWTTRLDLPCSFCTAAYTTIRSAAATIQRPPSQDTSPPMPQARRQQDAGSRQSALGLRATRRAMSSGVSSRLSRAVSVGGIASPEILPGNTSLVDRASWVMRLVLSEFRTVLSVFITAALLCEPKRSGDSRAVFGSLVQRICQTEGREPRVTTSRDRGLASACQAWLVTHCRPSGVASNWTHGTPDPLRRSGRGLAERETRL